MSTREISSKQEQYVANYMGGQITPNSGAGSSKKGDILVGDKGIIECKTKMTESKGITIRKEWLDKLKKESLAMGRPNWSLVFDFGNQKEVYAIIPLSDLKILYDTLEEE